MCSARLQRAECHRLALKRTLRFGAVIFGQFFEQWTAEQSREHRVDFREIRELIIREIQCGVISIEECFGCIENGWIVLLSSLDILL